MKGERNSSHVVILLFDDESYMSCKTYIEGLDSWKALEENYIVDPLP